MKMKANTFLFLKIFGIVLMQLRLCNADDKPYYLIKKNIRAMVLKDYDKVIGPTSQGYEPPLKVWFNLRVKKLDEINTKYQYLKIKATILIGWYDKFLTWDKSNAGTPWHNHSQTTYVQFMSNEIWTPDITLLNNAEEERSKNQKVHRVSVGYNGRVTWRFPTVLSSSCSLDVTRWPLDTQKCTLMFGSSAYYWRRMRIIGLNRTQKIPISSGEWSLRSSQMQEGFYEHGDGIKFSTVNYKLTVDRKPAYTLFYLTPPALILVLLTFMSFWIPSGSGERIGFVTTILLTMMVFLLLLPEYLPRTSDGLPVSGIIFIVAMVIIAIVLMATIVIVKFYHKEGAPPSWIQKLFCARGLRSFSFMQKLRCKVTSGQLPFTRNEIELEAIPPRSPEIRTAFDEDIKSLTWQELSNRLNWLLFVIILVAFLMTCSYVYSLR